MKHRKWISLLLALLLVLPALPAGMLAAHAEEVTVTSDTRTMTDGNTYTVTSDVTVPDRITVTGSVVLNLAAGATLTASSGIEVTGGNTLTIRGSGALVANGANSQNEYRAAIGSGFDFGNINIEGGTVTATGCEYAAGIGGGSHSHVSGTITITGGTVTATGGTNAAGIGGGSNHDWAGHYGNCGTIVISGGTVVANGNGGGAGIGGGGSTTLGAGSVGMITVSGGSVTANGGDSGYGIGPGVCTGDASENGTGCTLVIGRETGSTADLSLTASSYKGNVSTYENLAVLDGSVAYTGTFTDGQLSALAGKTLVTFENPRVMERVNVGGAEYYVYTGFTATAGVTGYNTQSYEMLVDGNMNTKYCVGTTAPYVEFYHAAGGFTPSGYIFTTAEDGYKYAGRNPKTWTLYGKVNESDPWTTLSSVSNDIAMKGVNRTNFVFPIDYTGENAPAAAAYKYFRFEVSALNGASTFQLMEFRFYSENPCTEFFAAAPATCTETGYAQDCYRRTDDGAFFADKACTQPLSASAVVLPPLGHSMTHHDAVAASCVNSGTVEYYECGRCLKFFADGEGAAELQASDLTVSATGHQLIYHSAVSPSVHANGTIAYYECTACGKIFADANAAQELTESQLPVVIETVNVDGTEYYVFAGFTKTDATGGNSGEGPEMLVDNNTSTKFCTGTVPLYVEFSTGVDFVPFGYILTTANDTMYRPGRNPKDWVLKAKVNENDDWTTLSAVMNDSVLQATNFTDYYFTIDYSGAYNPDPALFKYFRFEVSALQTPGTFQLSELCFYGLETALKYYAQRAATCLETGIAQSYYKRADGLCFTDAECTQPVDETTLITPLSWHTPVFHAAVPHTETENGNYAYYECSVCHRYFSDEACTNELREKEVIDYAGIVYLNENGDLTDLTETFIDVDYDTVDWSEGWYIVSSDVTVGERITVSGTVNLILCDGATLTAAQGVSVTSGNAINIFAQSTGGNMGALTATGTVNYRAGIGGSETLPHSGVISIYGGRITARGGGNGAGIGGGIYYVSGSLSTTVLGSCTVLIAGGVVTATGASDWYGAAGIGSASRMNSGRSCTQNITITGGTVTANGGAGAAGIGGGWGNGGGTITITGGTVTANGGSGDSYGIGSGGYVWPTEPVTIVISGGVVTATGAKRGIGSASTDGSITISGGKVTANGMGAQPGYGDYHYTLTLTLGANDFLNCTAQTYVDHFVLNGNYIVERNGVVYEGTGEEIAKGGLITCFDGAYHTVSFRDNDGTELSSQRIPHGYTAQEPPEPQKNGYRFTGWYVGGSAYDFGAAVTKDLTITAAFKAIPPLYYLDENGDVAAAGTYKIITEDTGGQTLPAGIYTISGNTTVSGKLYLAGDTVLILKNSMTLNVDAIDLAADASLAIYRQAPTGNTQQGKLVSEGRIAYTSNPSSAAKKIAIYGGDITATGSSLGDCGIGGASGRAGNVLIAGGTVTARSGAQGAAIGSGVNSAGGSVTITGGRVTAKPVFSGESTGIGGGDYSHGCVVVITGGVIDATGSGRSAGIGMGYAGSNYDIDYGCNVTITGGVVTADGGSSYYGPAPAIGSGGNYNGGSITITGGQITVKDSDCTTGIGGSVKGGLTSIVLGTTLASDFIYSPEYRGTITFANDLKLKGTNPVVYANTSNIAGKTLVGASTRDYIVRLYDENGTTLLAQQTVAPGKTIGTVDLPDRSSSGKIFIRWLQSGAPFDANTPVLEDLDLVAQYGAVKYLDEDGVLTTLEESFSIVTSSLTTWTNGWYVVQGKVTIDARVTVSGSVRLILSDGAVLTASQGINVRLGNAFDIFAQSEGGDAGVLNVPSAPTYAAGIGGYAAGIYTRENDSSGDIAIYGGVITVRGGNCGAGIGGGCTFGSANVLIAGGVVTAIAGYRAYGIGNGDDTENLSSTIVIKGGRVYVPEQGYDSFGIGGNDSTILLGCRDADNDSIFSFGYDGSVSYLNQLKVFGTFPTIFAMTDNIAGNTLVAADVLYGDVNEDGVITISDVTALLDILSGHDEKTAACDIDGNGSVTIADVTALLDCLSTLTS